MKSRRPRYQLGHCIETPGYRYRLNVITGADGDKRLAVVQINPSIADATTRDPTVGKVSYWAQENAFAHVAFLNLFALRTPYPAELLLRINDDLIGPKNDAVIEKTLNEAHAIVFGWGEIHEKLRVLYASRLATLRRLVGERVVHAVGLPVGTFPRHGRMWNRPNRAMRVFEWPETLNGVSG